MHIAVAYDKKNLVMENLISGLQSLEQKVTEIDISKTPQITLETLKQYDFVHDASTFAVLFNVMRENNMKNTLYQVLGYYPFGEYKSPVVGESMKQVSLIEKMGSGLEAEPAPRYDDISRYSHVQSPYFIYPDVDITGIERHTTGEKIGFLVGLAEHEMDETWKSNLSPLFKKYPILSISSSVPKMYKDYNPIILEDRQALIDASKDFKAFIYFTISHIPFPYLLLYPMAVGTKIITTSYGGNNELITHGKNGFIANNREAIEDAIAKLDTIPPPTVDKEFIYPNMARRYLDFYNLVLQNKLPYYEYTPIY
jgi:hypothetical protein